MERSTVLHVSPDEDPRRMSKGADRLRALARAALYGMAFFLPLLFFPGFIDGVELPKQALFAFLSLFAILAWLGAMCAERRTSFRGGWVHALALLLLCTALVSSVGSLEPVSSWFGGADLTLAFLTCTSVFCTFYAAMHIAAETRVQLRLIVLLLLSTLFAGGFALLAACGRIPFVLPGFTTVGNGVSLGVLLLASTVLGSALWIADPAEGGKPIFHGIRGRAFSLLLIFLSAETLLTLLALDLNAFWIVALFASACTLVFARFSPRALQHPARFAFPFLFSLFSVIFLAIPSPIHLNSLLPAVSPYDAMSLVTTRTSLLEGGVPRLLFGFGSGTFGITSLAHRPEGINLTPFWNAPPERAATQVISVFHAFGIVGGILLLLLGLLLLVRAVSVLTFERDLEEWGMTFALLVGWAALLSAHLLLPSTLTLTGIFALLSGMLASQAFPRVFTADFSRAPRLGLVASFVFVVLAVFGMTGAAYVGARLGSEALFSSAIRADQAGASTLEVAALLEEAALMNPFQIALLKNLAVARLRLAEERIHLLGEKPSSEEVLSIQAVVRSALQAAERASLLAPKDASVWSLRAQVYRALIPYASGAEDYAATAYARAIALDPANPELRTGAGRVSLLIADRARAAKASSDSGLAAEAVEAEKTNLAAAEDAFRQAIVLKADYAPAHYFLAAVYERENRLDEAAERLDLFLQRTPEDIGFLLERALLDVRRGHDQEAQVWLQKVLNVSPENSNAWWYLSVVAEQLGDRSLAMSAAERVFTLNPENPRAKARVAHFTEPAPAPLDIPEPLE